MTGDYPNRQILTVVPGNSGSPPAFSCSGGTTPVSATHYNCVRILLSGLATLSYTNVWVFDCLYDTGPDTCAASYLVKVSRFDDGTSPPPVIANTNAPQHGMAIGMFNDNISSGAPGWVNLLKAGITDTTTIPLLTARLSAVAMLGADLNHPNGASTAPAGMVSSYGDASFGDAIKGVYGGFTAQLNPWLISFPYPYAPQMQLEPTLISNSNAQICALLQQFQTQCNTYNAGHGTSLSLYAYLQQVYGSYMNLNPTGFASLQNSCGACKFILPSDIYLPPFLDPTSTGCITPTAYTAAKTSLDSLFADTLSDSTLNYEAIYTNYMNQKWGLSLSYTQYTSYDSLLLVNPAAILCNQVSSPIVIDTLACIESQEAWAVGNGTSQYNAYIETEKDLFRLSYVNTCSGANPNVSLTAPQKEYHYTLYYYDQADNLVRTVPPEGVTLLDSTQYAAVDSARDSGGAITRYLPCPYPADDLHLQYHQPGLTTAIPGWGHQPFLVRFIEPVSCLAERQAGRCQQLQLYGLRYDRADHGGWVEGTDRTKPRQP